MPALSQVVSQVGNFEARADRVVLNADISTKFMADIGWRTMPSGNGLINWSYDTLEDPSNDVGGSGGTVANAVLEGAVQTHASGDIIAATSVTNAVQEMVRLLDASMQQDMANKPEFGSGKLTEYERQAKKKDYEGRRNINASILSDRAAVTPTTTIRGVCAGAQNLIPAANRLDINSTQNKKQALAANLIKPTFDLASTPAYNNGGEITDCYMGKFQKEQIARWVQAPNRDISDYGTTFVDSVDTLGNAIGKKSTSFHYDFVMHFLYPRVVLGIQKDLWDVVWSVPPGIYREGQPAALSTRGFFGAAWSLYVAAPNQNFVIQNLGTQA